MVPEASQVADGYRNGKTDSEKKDAEDRLGFWPPILKGFITVLG